MRIVVDAMGTDRHPVPDVTGAVLAAAEIPAATLTLVGDEGLIRDELKKHRTGHQKLEIVHADESIHMDDKPAVVLKGKPRSSMHVGMKLLEDGAADAFVTMGNTGAAHAIATLHAPRRIRGVKRPALSVIFDINGHPTLFLDIGANTDSRVEWLVQFAWMGSIYAKSVMGLQRPRIALLSNGEEDTKGTQVIREAGEHLRASALDFIGNAEPKDVFYGKADVIVSDGFHGNLLIKTFEATGRYVSHVIRSEVRRDPLSLLGSALMLPAFRRARRRLDSSEIGGAPLLGVNGVVIIGHGSSTSYGVKNAIRQAYTAVKGRIVEQMGARFAEELTPEA